MNFKMCAKANISLECLRDRKNKGFELLELYTDPQTFENNNDFIAQRIDEFGLKCVVVHAPHETGMRKNVADCGFAGLTDQINQKSIELVIKSIDLADKVLKTEDRFVVVHPASQTFISDEFNNMFLLERGERYKKIKEARENSISNGIKNLKTLLEYAKNKNINICIENMPNIDMSFNGKYATYCTFAYPEDFKRILKELDKSNLMITFDVCHLLNHIRIIRMLSETNGEIGCNLPEDIEVYKEKLKNDDHEILIVEDFLEVFKGKIGVIHLNNSIEFGFTKNTHSTKFTEKDKYFLESFFKKLKDINYKKPITLEINERDLKDAANLLETYKTIRSLDNYKN